MYLTLHAVHGLPDPTHVSWVDDVLATLAAQDTPSGALVGRLDKGRPRGQAVLFWHSREQAQRCAALHGDPGDAGDPTEGTRPVTLDPGAVFEYTVRDTASDAAAHYLKILQYHGPRTPEWIAAHQRGGRERVLPAVRDVPGRVIAITGWADDGGSATLVLAETTEAILESGRRIAATTPLPYERPDLLTRPDHVETDRLLHADLPPELFAVSVTSTPPS